LLSTHQGIAEGNSPSRYKRDSKYIESLYFLLNLAVEYYVYIIYSTSRDKYYTGYSQNPEERLVEHNSGATISTRTGKPWVLVYQEKCMGEKQH